MWQLLLALAEATLFLFLGSRKVRVLASSKVIVSQLLWSRAGPLLSATEARFGLILTMPGRDSLAFVEAVLGLDVLGWMCAVVIHFLCPLLIKPL